MALRGIALRLIAVVLCLAIILNPMVLIEGLDWFAREVAGGAAGGGAFALSDFIMGRVSLIFSLLEGFAARNFAVQTFLMISAVLLAMTLAVQVVAVIYWNMRLIVFGVAGLVAMSFGGLSQTSGVALGYVRQLIGSAFGLLIALVIIGVFLDLSWDVRAAGSPFAASAALLVVDLFMAILLWTLPSTAVRIAEYG